MPHQKNGKWFHSFQAQGEMSGAQRLKQFEACKKLHAVAPGGTFEDWECVICGHNVWGANASSKYEDVPQLDQEKEFDSVSVKDSFFGSLTRSRRGYSR